MSAEAEGGGLRVLHVVTDRDRRGAQTFGIDLADGLRRLGVANSVVALAPGEHGDGLAIDALGPTRRSPTTIRALRRAARRHDVVVAHGSTTLPVTAAALTGLRLPFVYRQISDPLHWASTASRRARVGVMLRRAARVVALSPGAAEVVRRHYALRSDRITVIPNAVPADEFTPPDEATSARARAGFGIHGDDVLLVYVGALVPEKGVDLAIRTVADRPGTQLLVVGDGERRAVLEDLAVRTTGARVSFAGPTERPLAALHAADLLVFPSLAGDSMPAVLIEAGLTARASVATDVGSIADIVVDGVTGRIVPPGDRSAFEAAVGELVADSSRRRAMGEAARARCLERFTIASTAPDWLGVLSDVAARRTRTG